MSVHTWNLYKCYQAKQRNQERDGVAYVGMA